MAAAFSGEDAVNSGKYGVSTDQPKPIILDELRQARKQIELLKNMHPFRAAEMALELELEKMRLGEAINARDAAVQRLDDAYICIRRQSTTIEQLQREGDKLITDPQCGAASVNNELTAMKCSEVEIRRLEATIESLQEELQTLQNAVTATSVSKFVTDSPPSYEEGIPADKGASNTKSANEIADQRRSCAPSSAFREELLETIQTPPCTPEICENLRHILSDSHDADSNVIQSMPQAEPLERIVNARHSFLATLPIPDNIPDHALKPIIILPPITLHEFLANSPGPLRNSLSNHRVFQQVTTSWCPEREEHGYLLAPAFKCSTNPRVLTAHRWSSVDVIGRLNNPTECFYNKDGKWYYAGVYLGFRMKDLTSEEWAALSNETTQAIIKETLAGRKNVSPQNLYETTQLYAAGALKVGCVGLKCIGFNNELYRTILEQANKCAGIGMWRNGPGSVPNTSNGATARSSGGDDGWGDDDKSKNEPRCRSR